MELELMNAFIAGVFAGGFLLGFGFTLGRLSDGGIMHKRVDDVPYNPDDQPIDEDFFQEHWDSDNADEFPTDAQLELLHRHSEVNDA